MDQTEQLIQDYCRITGRPAFTITVEEYLAFMGIHKEMMPVNPVATAEIKPAMSPIAPKVEKQEKPEVVKKTALDMLKSIQG